MESMAHVLLYLASQDNEDESISEESFRIQTTNCRQAFIIFASVACIVMILLIIILNVVHFNVS